MYSSCKTARSHPYFAASEEVDVEDLKMIRSASHLWRTEAGHTGTPTHIPYTFCSLEPHQFLAIVEVAAANRFEIRP
jgi:hypothetical protein